MRSIRKFVVLFIVLALSVSACNGTSGGTSDIEKTLEALSVQATVDRAVALTGQADGASGGGGNTDAGDTGAGSGDTSSPPTDTPIPVATDTPQPTATPTLGKPMVSVSVDTNCRKGPGQVYDPLGALLVGEQAEITAWDGYGIYYYVVNPDGAGYCWLWAEYASIVGDASGLPVFTPPPTPTPTYTPTPENLWHGDWNMIVSGATYPVTLSQSGKSVSGSFPVGANTVTLNGTVSNDGKTINGAYSVSGSGITGTFFWQLKKNINQFVGNGTPDGGGATEDWCGHRPSASMPSPCGP